MTTTTTTTDAFSVFRDEADDAVEAPVERLVARYHAALEDDKNLTRLAYGKDASVREEVDEAIKRVRRQNRVVANQSAKSVEPVTASRLAIDLGFGSVPDAEAIAFVQQQLHAHEASRARKAARRVLTRLHAYDRLAAQSGCATGARAFARPCLTQSNVRRMVNGAHVGSPDSYGTDELRRRLIVKRTPLTGKAWNALHSAAETLMRRWVTAGVHTAVRTRGRASLMPGDLPLDALEERLPGWTVAAPAEGLVAHARRNGAIGDSASNESSLKAWTKVVSANRALVAAA